MVLIYVYIYIYIYRSYLDLIRSATYIKSDAVQSSGSPIKCKFKKVINIFFYGRNDSAYPPKRKKSQILPQSLNLSKLSTFIYEINARKICDFFVTLKFLYLWKRMDIDRPNEPPCLDEPVKHHRPLFNLVDEGR